MSHKIANVSVILPTYNEVDNIVPLADALHAAIVHPHEVIVVDDNSPDGTSPAVARAIEEGRPWLRLETRTHDRGLTNSLRRGVELATGDTITWMDCDFSMPPADVPRLLAAVEQGADLAVGSRFAKGGVAKERGERESMAAIVLSKLLNIILAILLTSKFRDWTSGFIAIRTDVVRTIGFRGDYGEYFMDLAYRAILGGYRVVELPYVSVPRVAGHSKTAPDLKTLLRRCPGYLGTLVRMVGLRLRSLFRR